MPVFLAFLVFASFHCNPGPFSGSPCAFPTAPNAVFPRAGAVPDGFSDEL